MTSAPPVRYAVLLRGVNVGGHRKVAMTDLRAVAAGLGHRDVATVLQSGNLLLTAPASLSAERLAAGLEEALRSKLGLTTRVLPLTHEQLGVVIDENPFPTADDEPAKHLVQFLDEPPGAALRSRIEAFDATPFAPDELRAGNEVVYLRFPGGMGRSKLGPALERHLRATAVMTGRNWNTVRTLHARTAPGAT